MMDTNILIVEDEGIVAKDIQEMLEKRGYYVPSIAFSGEEAIEKVEAQCPDLILMDIRLKGKMDGVQAAGQIRSRFDIPVVYLTVYTDENTLKRVRATEPFGYILKPFKETELCMTIQTALNKHNIERELKGRVQGAEHDLDKARRFSDIGIFASMIAHELQSPLDAMKTAVSGIKEGSRDLLLEGAIADIEQKISQSDRIINNLLNYAHLTRPRYEFISVMNVLDERLNAYLEKYFQWNITVEKKYYCTQSDFIEAEPMHIVQLFNNILENIVHAFEDKQGEITAEISYNIEENICRIIFRDNGVGVAEDDLPKIFDPFFAKKTRGIGLGLSLCRNIIDLYNGTINVTSQKGFGTTVCIHFPITQKLSKNSEP